MTPDVQRELRRRTVRWFLRSRIIIAVLSPFAVLIHAIVGFGEGVVVGIKEVRSAWDALG